MSRARRAVGVLVLLDVDEVPVEVRDEDRDGRAVGVVLVPRALDGVGRVDPGVEHRQVRLLARAGQFVFPQESPDGVKEWIVPVIKHCHSDVVRQRAEQTVRLRREAQFSLRADKPPDGMPAGQVIGHDDQRDHGNDSHEGMQRPAQAAARRETGGG